MDVKTRITPYKNREVNHNEPIDLYRCLNRKGHVYSLRQNGLVVGHTDEVKLINCRPMVKEAGQKRCRITQSRNVHAWLTCRIPQFNYINNWTGYPIIYNPYQTDNFVFERDNDLTSFEFVEVIIVKNGRIYGNGFL